MSRATLRRRLAWITLLALVLAAGAYFARVPLLTRIGTHLVRVDPLARGDAIVVLSGGTPMREIEAADLYLAGYAPTVLLTVEGEPPAWDVLRARGMRFETRLDLRKRVIRALGVPDSAVTVLDGARVNSTRMETELIKEWVSSHRAKRIIVVTSPFHTARSSLIFSRMLRSEGVEVLTRPAPLDPFQADGWWRDRDQLRSGIIEWQKLLFYYVAYR